MIDPDHPGSKLPINTAVIRQFLRSAQRALGIPGDVNVRIISDQEMRRLNREFRGKNRPTDVLSFPASVNGNSTLAGDIAISSQIASTNARALGHTLESEIKILLLHGLLHLAGHDHESDSGEMAALEQKLRAKLKLPLGLIARASSSNVVRANVQPAAPGRVSRELLKRAAGTKASANLTKPPAEGGRFHVRPKRARAKRVRSHS